MNPGLFTVLLYALQISRLTQYTQVKYYLITLY